MKYQIALLTLLLAVTGCQQGQAANDERLAPEPLVEAIDPEKNPIAAVKAKEKQMNVKADQDVDALRREALELIGDASADDNSQCRVTGFGHKPCGGPAQYIAYSTKEGNEEEILARIAAYNAAAEAENMRLGRMSDCAVVPKPAVELSGGQCKLVKNNSY
ncbi:hypothetical protein [Arsukibacterium sp.]|uniref:hypothetical protein n=1 Tax=Arsukibacterium sp. TaxID=1977258 RepID=UPI001BD1EFA9|nr:hypothetical protein [Arsukibacterium sp.]